ncbi:hypothetical protein NECID01_1461 [Nematocida sp. AWRm77]|nr:hypothetical protein NECID01_1461 [Nematocida sp. AWRm77]
MSFANFLRLLGIGSSAAQVFYTGGDYLSSLNKKDITIYGTLQPTYRLIYNHESNVIRLLNIQAIKKKKEHINGVMVLEKTSADNEYYLLVKPRHSKASTSNPSQIMACFKKADNAVVPCVEDSGSGFVKKWKIEPLTNGYRIKDSENGWCMARESSEGHVKVQTCNESSLEQRFDMLEVKDDPYKNLYLSGAEAMEYELSGMDPSFKLPPWMGGESPHSPGPPPPGHIPGYGKDTYPEGSHGPPYPGSSAHCPPHFSPNPMGSKYPSFSQGWPSSPHSSHHPSLSNPRYPGKPPFFYDPYNPTGNSMDGSGSWGGEGARGGHVVDLHDLKNNLGKVRDIVDELKGFCNGPIKDLGMCTDPSALHGLQKKELEKLFSAVRHKDKDQDKTRRSRSRKERRSRKGRKSRHKDDSDEDSTSSSEEDSSEDSRRRSSRKKYRPRHRHPNDYRSSSSNTNTNDYEEDSSTVCFSKECQRRADRRIHRRRPQYRHSEPRVTHYTHSLEMASRKPFISLHEVPLRFDDHSYVY